MQLHKRRQLSQTGPVVVEEDSDSEDTEIDPRVLAIYEDLDSAEPPPLRRVRQDGLSTFHIFVILFVCLCAFAVLANIFTYRQVQKIKAEKGNYKNLVHPEIWWNGILAYYVYPKSFQDSDGDGVGDIKGIIQRIDHLQYLHVQAVILGSVMKAASLEDGHDILDFLEVDPAYGTNDDLKALIAALHDRDIKLILEVTPNHTSKKHKWFQLSRDPNADKKYKNYYIWHPGKKAHNGSTVRPSNWLSKYGGSAWEWDEMRGQYYLHQYGVEMPDLNHRDAHVREEMMSIFKSWLDLDVDGVLMEGVDTLFEMEEFTLDEPEMDGSNAKPHQYNFLEHIYTHDQPDVHEFMATWRELVDDFYMKTKKRVLLSAAIVDDMMIDVHKYYETGLDVPLNYFLAQMPDDCDGWCLHSIIDAWMMGLDDGKTTFWMLSSTELGRMASKKGLQYAGAYAMLHFLLPGAAVLYYGEEIGMTNAPLTFHDTKDLRAIFAGHDAYHECSRDPWRTPMQWDNSTNSGFTTADKSWLPMHPAHRESNVQVQHDRPGHSLLKFYRELAMLRKQDAFRIGSTKSAVASKNIFSFMRYLKDDAVYLVSINIGKEPEIQDFSDSVGVDSGPLKMFYSALENGLPKRTFAKDEVINLEKFEMFPGEAMVVQLF